MDEERGRFDFIGVFHRAVLPELLRVRPEGRAALILGEVGADIGYAVKARPVRYGALAGAGAEAVGVADDPVGHKSAVGAAGLEEVIAVHLRVSGERRVAEGHEIVEIHRAVFAADVHERAAPVAARGVAENDEVSPARGKETFRQLDTPYSKRCAIIFLKKFGLDVVFAAETVVHR